MPAGDMPAGSVAGLSGLNYICDRINSVMSGNSLVSGTSIEVYGKGAVQEAAGSTFTAGSIWLISGPIGSGVQILAANTNRKTSIIYNNIGSDIWIGNSSIIASGTDLSLLGYRLTSNEMYEYQDTEALYGTTLKAGSADVRFLEITK